MDEISLFLANLGQDCTAAQRKRLLPPPPPRLASNLRTARKRHGLTQEALSKKAGISPEIVSKLEKGRNTGAKYLAKISAVLGLTTEELCEGQI